MEDLKSTVVWYDKGILIMNAKVVKDNIYTIIDMDNNITCQGKLLFEDDSKAAHYETVVDYVEVKINEK